MLLHAAMCDQKGSRRQEGPGPDHPHFSPALWPGLLTYASCCPDAHAACCVALLQTFVDKVAANWCCRDKPFIDKVRPVRPLLLYLYCRAACVGLSQGWILGRM